MTPPPARPAARGRDAPEPAMAIEFDCPTCGSTLRVEDHAAGQMIRCGGCMATLRVPEPPRPHDHLPVAAPVAPPADHEPTADRPRRRRRRPAAEPAGRTGCGRFALGCG